MEGALTMKSEVKFTVRLDPTLAKKLAYIADYYGRSQNGQISWLVKQCVTEFEHEHGAIVIED